MATILFSLDDGDSWFPAWNEAAGVSPVDLIRAGDTGPFFALRDSSGEGSTAKAILRSNDGQVWVEFTDPLAAAEVSGTPSGLAYDIVRDQLYIAYQDQSYAFALLKASQCIPAQVNAALAAVVIPADILTDGVAGFWRALSPISEGAVARGPRNIVRLRPAPP